MSPLVPSYPPGEEVRVDQERVALLADVLGAPAPRPGEELAPLWHWAALSRWEPLAGLGRDGHPHPPAPVAGLARMFAGGRAWFRRPLVVDEPVRVRTSSSAPVDKQGRSGALLILTTTTTIEDLSGELLVTEQQDLVYRQPVHRPAAVGAVPGDAGTPGTTLRPGDAGWVVAPHPADLMRFSVATSNSHRIHYDLAYTTGQEGHEGLLVHGPLQTLCLLEAHRRDSGAPEVRRLRHRGIAPLICGTPARARECDPGHWVLGDDTTAYSSLSVNPADLVGEPATHETPEKPAKPHERKS